MCFFEKIIFGVTPNGNIKIQFESYLVTFPKKSSGGLFTSIQMNSR